MCVLGKPLRAGAGAQIATSLEEVQRVHKNGAMTPRYGSPCAVYSAVIQLYATRVS